MPAEHEKADNRQHRKVKVPVRAHPMCSRFEEQTERSRYGDDIGECNHERQAGHSGKLRDLNERPVGMEGHA